MAITFFVTVQFLSESVEDATAVVQSWAIPEGAMVNTSANQSVDDLSGTVDSDGNIVPPYVPPPAEVVADNGAPDG